MIAPDFAYDDGRFTYIGFCSMKKLPAVFCIPMGRLRPIRSPDNTDKPETVKSTESSVNRRSDLGQGVDPFKQEEPPKAESVESTPGAEAAAATPGAPAPITFSGRWRSSVITPHQVNRVALAASRRRKEDAEKAEAVPSKRHRH
ncbi:hypothetical protein TNCV_4379631 [Trichonephila clavipes]|nr:hypothetical protein TNCV_4379631 [Trichonephila clavipes]